MTQMEFLTDKIMIKVYIMVLNELKYFQFVKFCESKLMIEELCN
ncbi:hypothetical protein SDC9_192575 [bioreactor metagenome]|uniref:Uncharacterized protein n=1 Tax=bioreactor metagenome TaxID=1076179 RepID=A0A645I179_9ZZZZ